MRPAIRRAPVVSGCARVQSMHVDSARLRLVLLSMEQVHTIDIPVEDWQSRALQHLHDPTPDCPGVGPAALGLLRRVADRLGGTVCRAVVQPGPTPVCVLRIGDHAGHEDLAIDIVEAALLMSSRAIPVEVGPTAAVDWDAALQTLADEE